MLIPKSRARGLQVVSLTTLCVVGFFALASGGCVSSAGIRPIRAIEAPSTVSAATILRPSAVDPEIELEAIVRTRTTPALLRRAYLEIACRRPQAAIDACAEVLYGPEKPAANEEAFARYLRASGYTMLGKPERGALDLERARALAMDPELQRLAGQVPRTSGSTRPVLEPVLTVAVQDRSAWTPRPAERRSLEPMGRPTRLTIHHSAMYFRDTNTSACAAHIQQIQREHMGNRGYGDIGYHFLIDPAGRVWEGRELRWQGAHASGDNNRQNIGICVLGNFLRGRGGQGPSSAQVQTLRQLVQQLMHRYSFGADAIHNHSDFKATECPGPLMESVVARLVSDFQNGTNRLAAAAASH